MRMPDSEVAGISNGAAGIQRTCAACASGQGLYPQCAEEERLQRKPLAANITSLIQRQGEGVSNNAPQVTAQIAANIEALHGGGRPLPPSTRAFFVPRFGSDLSGVRVHTDSRAAQIARSVNARAFTFGRDLVFGAGEFSPGSSEGQKLMAHELTHVVQQHSHRSPESLVQRDPPGTPIAPDLLDCTPDITNSSSPEEDIRAAVNMARDLVDRALQNLNNLTQVRAEFCPSQTGPCPTPGQIATIRQKYNAILGWLPNSRFICNSQNVPACRQNPDEPTATVGFVRGCPPPPTGRVHLCPIFFRQLDFCEKAAAIIHEGAHRVGVCPSGNECYDRRHMNCYPPPNAVTTCADSYSQFAMSFCEQIRQERQRAEEERFGRERPIFVPESIRQERE